MGWKIAGGLALLLVATACCSPAARTLPKEETQTHRISRRSLILEGIEDLVNETPLPGSVSPMGYKLSLYPDLEEATFSGLVLINLTCIEETNTVTLHGDQQLHILGAEAELLEMDSDGTHSLPVAGTDRDFDKQWFIITLVDKLRVGAEYKLKLNFQGNLSTERAHGFYRSYYQDTELNVKRWFAGIQTVQNEARYVFPCFDEPALKAPFEISIARTDKYNTLSNMPLRATEPLAGDWALVWDHYVQSPPMSTYSVGVFVSDLISVTPTQNEKLKVAVRVFGRNESRSELEDTANLVALKIREAEDDLGITFPLPKLDIVQAPEHNTSRTQDHFGLIVFENKNLWSFKTFRLNSYLRLQWFAHAISPQSWKDADFVNAVSLFSKLLNDTRDYFTNPVKAYSRNVLYYQFGDRVTGPLIPSLNIPRTVWFLRMLNYTISEDVMKQSYRKFYEERKYKTYTNNSLWKQIDSASPDQLQSRPAASRIARSWLTYNRFPVVTVTRNYEANTADVEQHVFIRDNPKDIPGKDAMKWCIPIMYLTQDNMDLSSIRTKAWMDEEEHISIDNVADADKFIVVNPNDIGYFIVNYDQTNWARLSQYMVEHPNRLTMPIRNKLLHDAWSLGLSGELDFNTVLNLTLFLPHEKNIHVWSTQMMMLLLGDTQLQGTEAAPKLKEYGKRLIKSLTLDNIDTSNIEPGEPTSELRMIAETWENDSDAQRYAEVVTTYRAWMASSPPEEHFEYWNSDEACLVFSYGTLDEWEFGLKMLIKFPFKFSSHVFLSDLVECTQDHAKNSRILKGTILDVTGKITDEDVKLVLTKLSNHYKSYNTMFHFLEENWEAVHTRLENKPELWEEVIRTATGLFKTQEGLDMVMRLYEARKEEFGTARETIETSLTVVRAQVEWTRDNVPVIEAWLDHYLLQTNGTH